MTCKGWGKEKLGCPTIGTTLVLQKGEEKSQAISRSLTGKKEDLHLLEKRRGPIRTDEKSTFERGERLPGQKSKTLHVEGKKGLLYWAELLV